MPLPKLLLFAPCEKSLLDNLSERVSLINIVDSVNSPVVDFSHQAERVPEDQREGLRQARYFIPTMMFVIVWWQEQNLPYTFLWRIVTRAPDGRERVQAEFSLEVTHNYHRVFHVQSGIAARLAGIYHFGLEIRENNQEEWTEVANYPLILQELQITVEDAQQPETETASATTG